MASKQQQGFRMCVHPCPRYLMCGDTHILCVACLGEEHARSALETSGCEHCDVLPLQTLRSRLALFREGAQARVTQGSGPTAAEAQWRLLSWGSQKDLSAEVETGTALSLPSPDRFSASSQGWEACAAVSSTPIEAQTLQLSDSEELDLVSANARDTEDSPPQSRAYEELVEVLTRAVEKLSIDWPAEREEVRSNGKLDEGFLPSGISHVLQDLSCKAFPKRLTLWRNVRSTLQGTELTPRKIRTPMWECCLWTIAQHLKP